MRPSGEPYLEAGAEVEPLNFVFVLPCVGEDATENDE